MPSPINLESTAAIGPAAAVTPRSKSATAGVLLYLPLLLALCAVAWLKPAEHADRFLYQEAVKASRGDIHLTLPERVPLYSVKVLYVLSSKYIGTKASTVLSYFALGILIWVWTERRSIASFLLIGSYVCLDTARMGTPDAMQAFLLLLGAWLILKKNQFLGAVPLLLAVWVRTDALILVLLVALLAWYERKLRFPDVAVIGVLAVASWAVIGHFGYSYTYLLQFTLHASYLHGLAAEALRSNLTMLFPYLLLAIPARRNPLVLIAIFGYVAHFLLFPNAETRYALPYVLIVGAEAILAIYNLAPRPVSIPQN